MNVSIELPRRMFFLFIKRELLHPGRFCQLLQWQIGALKVIG
jgi:hypothetical protein